MHRPTDRISHTTAFVTPVVEHWLEREIVLYWFRVVGQEGRKEVFYLTTHSTHLVTVIRRRIAREETHGLLFPISSKGSFICTIPQTG